MKIDLTFSKYIRTEIIKLFFESMYFQFVIIFKIDMRITDPQPFQPKDSEKLRDRNLHFTKLASKCEE